MSTMLLPCGKLIGLLFCLLVFLSILFLKPKFVHKTFSSTELTCPVMGTIFLVLLEKWFPLQGERAHSFIYGMYIKRLEFSKTK